MATAKLPGQTSNKEERSPTRRRRQLQKRDSLPAIRNPGSRHEYTLLVPARQISYANQSPTPYQTEKTSFGEFDAYDKAFWLADDDKDCTERHTDLSSREMYLAACKKMSISPSRQVWRQLTESAMSVKNQPLGPVGTKAVSVSLVVSMSMTSIELSGCRLGVHGLAYLLEALEWNSSITTVNISGNELKCAGARLLCDFLARNKVLCEVDASRNGFEDDDAQYFAAALQKNTSVEKLTLSHNNFREKAGPWLEQGIAYNNTLTSLDLSWNHLRHTGAVAIARSLQYNSTLAALEVSWNGFGMDGCYEMAKSLRKNQTLSELDLTCNRINFEAFSFLLTGISCSKSLRVLKIGHNPITSDGATAILKILHDRPSCGLQHLELTDISVNVEFMSILEQIQSRREFTVKHGRLSSLTDKRQELKTGVFNTDDPLLLLYEYTKSRNLRVVDLFHSLDKDHSYGLTRTEFRNGLKSVGLSLSDWSLDILMKRLDADNDGIVNFEELIIGQKEYNRKTLRRRQQQQSSLDSLSVIMTDKLRVPPRPPSRPDSTKRSTRGSKPSSRLGSRPGSQTRKSPAAVNT